MRSIEANEGFNRYALRMRCWRSGGVSYRHQRDMSRIGPSEIPVNLSGTGVDINVAKLYLRDIQIGRNSIRSVHSSSFVAVQIKIRSSAAVRI